MYEKKKSLQFAFKYLWSNLSTFVIYFYSLIIQPVKRIVYAFQCRRICPVQSKSELEMHVIICKVKSPKLPNYSGKF